MDDDVYGDEPGYDDEPQPEPPGGGYLSSDYRAAQPPPQFPTAPSTPRDRRIPTAQPRSEPGRLDPDYLGQGPATGEFDASQYLGRSRREPDSRYRTRQQPPPPSYERRPRDPAPPPGYDSSPRYDQGYDLGPDPEPPTSAGYRTDYETRVDPGTGYPPETRPGYGEEFQPEPGYTQGYEERAPYGESWDSRYDQDFDQLLDEELPPSPTAKRPPRKRTKPDPSDRGPKLPHLPGLNGLRAVALLAVLAFMHDADWLPGGYLGISTVFTLSGFLMATLALAEWSQTTQLFYGRFWDRRARNLLPTYLAVIALAVALQNTVRVGSVPTFRGDVWAALGFVTNWRLAFPSEGFASSFSELSTLRHLWPVAITAQAYLLFPLVFVFLMLVTGRQWRASGYFFAALAALSFGAAWMVSATPDGRRIAYYGTHTRIGEMLVGVTLAYLVLTPGFRTFLNKPQVIGIVRNGAVAAMVALLALWVLVPQDSPSLFHGVTVLNALLTAWVILAVTMPGPAASILGFAPLRHLGEISYPAYLFAWPLFLLIDEDRTGLSGPALFGARLGAALAAGVVAYWVLQAPFRSALKATPQAVAGGFVGAGAVLAAVVLVLPVNPPPNISLAIDDGKGPGDLEVVTPVGGGQGDLRVLLVGDQAAGSLASGFAKWNQDPRHENQQFTIDTHVTDDCPLGGPGRREALDRKVDTSMDCAAWRPRLSKMLDAAKYDAIVVAMGGADLGSRKVGRHWQHLGDPGYDVWMAEQIDGLADVLSGEKAPVLWSTYPHVRLTDPDRPGDDWERYDDNDPHRVDRLNELIQSTVGNRKHFQVADLAAWLYQVPLGEFNPQIRTGPRFTEAGAQRTVADWLAPKLLTAAGVDATPTTPSTTSTAVTTTTTLATAPGA